MGTWVAFIASVQFSSVAQSCLTLCDPMNHTMPALPVLIANNVTMSIGVYVQFWITVSIFFPDVYSGMELLGSYDSSFIRALYTVLWIFVLWDSVCGSAAKESICNAGDLGSIPGLGWSLEAGKDSSILAWRIPWTTVLIRKRWTQLSDSHLTSLGEGQPLPFWAIGQRVYLPGYQRTTRVPQVVQFLNF